jgi:hypothetical protein
MKQNPEQPLRVVELEYFSQKQFALNNEMS